MTESLALLPSAVESQLNRNAVFRKLRKMVLNSVVSEHSKRNYAKALSIRIPSQPVILGSGQQYAVDLSMK